MVVLDDDKVVVVLGDEEGQSTCKVLALLKEGRLNVTTNAIGRRFFKHLGESTSI